MRYWLTAQDAPIVTDHVKRFDPRHWTTDFPRGCIASVVTTADGHGLVVRAEFLRKGDLVGLIYESEDAHAHPAHKRETKRDYSNCTLSFRWQSSGAILGLDALDGPTLTIEGRDGQGVERSWFVRLWNYAQGTPSDALISLDFNSLDAGFALPADAERVDVRNIDRMFISLVPHDYVEGSAVIRSAPVSGTVTLSEIRSEGSGSVLQTNDAIAPEHPLGIATAYDDMYHLPPGRIVDWIERLGYRGVINHYVGMSHYFALDGAARLDPNRTLNGPALEWHREFARHAAARGYALIWSISYEILDMFCPEAWKQRTFAGMPAATGWEPPSALVSPANAAAIAFLCDVVQDLVGLSNEAGLQPQIQIGEPWWWVTQSGAICLYDDAARAALGGNPVEITDVRGALTAQQRALLDAAGALLAQSTATIAAAANSADPATRTLLLVYLPTILDPAAPELRRANMPVGWAYPSFDVLQLEDYEWVTNGASGLRNEAYQIAQQRLGYPLANQHYMAGFVASPTDRHQWRDILAAADEGRTRRVEQVLLWALPQVLRDGLTLSAEEDDLDPFDDLSFPIEIGAEATVVPGFSTNVVTSASGHEYRNANWQQARLRFDAGPGIRGDAELQTLISFFRARRGPAVGFRFRDPFDHSSSNMTALPGAGDVVIGVGDGAKLSFPLIKRYGSGEERRITRPVPGTVRVAVNGAEQVSGWTLGNLGTIQFASAPAAGATVTAGFLFDTPVRFADDRIEVNRATFRAGEAPSVPLIEIREG